MWTVCIRLNRFVLPERVPLGPEGPPLRPVHPECLGVLRLHLLHLAPPNTVVPVLTTWPTCHGLIPSGHTPWVSSRPGVSRVYMPDSGSPMACVCPAMPHNAHNTLPTLKADSSPHRNPASTLRGPLPSSAPCRRPSQTLTLLSTLAALFADSYTRRHPAGPPTQTPTCVCFHPLDF